MFKPLASAHQAKGAHHFAAAHAQAFLDGLPRFAGRGRRAVVDEGQLPHGDSVIAVQDLAGDRVHDDHPAECSASAPIISPHPRLRVRQHGMEGGEEGLAEGAQEAVEAAAFQAAVDAELVLETDDLGRGVVEELGRVLILLLLPIVHDLNHGPAYW